VNKVLSSVLVVILVLAIAGASFYGGMVFGKSQAQASVPAAGAVVFQAAGGAVQGLSGGPAAQGTPGAGTPGAGTPGAGMPGAFGGRGQRMGQGGNFVLGTIKQIGEGSLVLTDMNGQETQVKVTDTTLIEKNASVKLGDLAEGEMVMVSGSTAADGTLTARSVQVAPRGRFGALSPAGGPGAAPDELPAGAPVGGAEPQLTPAP
jgi:hypothetical protein